MIKKLIQLLSTMLLLTIIITVAIHAVSPKIKNDVNAEANSENKNKLKIVTTIYPVYMIGLNIADQVDSMEVTSLIKMNTGCLHDYQLTTKDMKLISTADILVINGGGMEAFLSDVKANYPKLKIIDASQGITMLHSHEEEHNHDTDLGVEDSDQTEQEKEDHNHGEYNAHVWLDPKLYIQQIDNVRNGLIDYINHNPEKSFPDTLESVINKNAESYIQKVKKLDQRLENARELVNNSYLGNKKQNEVVIFHDSFAYLANRMNMKVAFAVDLDADTSLSAGEIAEIIDEVKKDGIKHLFTEKQFSDSIAKQIAEETGTKVTIIDSAVTGQGDKNSYLNSMENNLMVIENMNE